MSLRPQASLFVVLSSVALIHCGGATSTAGPTASEVGPAPTSDTTHAATTEPPALSSASPAAPAAAPEAKPHWTYEGEHGPSHWSDLSADYATCSAGKEQSPIDLPKKGELHPKHVRLLTSYKAVPLKILNNGHTVQVDGTGEGTVKLGDATYELVQFHFHAPSEHKFAGKSFPLEMHLVHKNAAGQLAVVGVLFEEGKENTTLKDVFANAPKEESKEATTVAGVQIDLSKFIPAGADYFDYPGSLTTPPCSEGVNWIVIEAPQKVGKNQIDAFRTAVHNHDTARPVQPLGARKVSEEHL